MDHPLSPDEITSQQYYYGSDQESQTYSIPPYGSPMAPYQVVHDSTQSRHLNELHQYQQNMPMIYPGNPVYNHSPPHVSLPLSHQSHTHSQSQSPPPPSPEIYDPLSPPISGSDTSADGIYNSSGGNSPSSSRGNSLVHRTPHNIRYNPTPSPTSSSGRRSRGGHSVNDSDEDDMGAAMRSEQNVAHARKEATRRQRIEAEQRRRDELRDGYAKLKDVLPVSNQKSSKVSLLERATNYIQQLEAHNRELQSRLQLLDQEMQRLRALNEKISLPSHEQDLDVPSPATIGDARPLSPPPDIPLMSSQNRTHHHPHSEGSSPSTDGF